MRLFAQPKIDGHCHVLDPARFPYPAQVAYHPSGQEVGTAAYLTAVMQTYGVRHALLVGPNSGYGTDNRCLLEAIANGQGRFKGMAVLPTDVSWQALTDLQAQGIVGVAFNPSLHGVAYYHDVAPLLDKLAALGLWAQFQVAGDQLAELLPRVQASGVRVLIDHCGRPNLDDGPQALGLKALEQLALDGRSVIKLSGFAKFSKQGYPFADTQAHVRQLMRWFGPKRCIWASDWPFLRAPYRLDYGTLLGLADHWFTPDECQQMMWDAPARIFNW